MATSSFMRFNFSTMMKICDAVKLAATGKSVKINLN